MSHMSSNNRQVSLMHQENIQDKRPNAIKLFKRGFSNYKQRRLVSKETFEFRLLRYFKIIWFHSLILLCILTIEESF